MRTFRQPKGGYSFLGALVSAIVGGIVGIGIACLAGWVCWGGGGGGGGGGGSQINAAPGQCFSDPNVCGLTSIGSITSTCPSGYTLTPPGGDSGGGNTTCYSVRAGQGSDEPATVYIVDGNGNYVTQPATQSCNATPPPASMCPAPAIGSNGFYATPATIGLNSKTTLHWTSSNTTSCSISGDNGYSYTGGGSSGSVDVTGLTQTTTFTLTCEDGSGGPTASKSIRVLVDPHYKEL